MASTQQYLEEIAATGRPTPRANGGRVLDLRISLYDGGHTGITAKGATGLALNSDRELAEAFKEVVFLARRRMDDQFGLQPPRRYAVDDRVAAHHARSHPAIGPATVIKATGAGGVYTRVRWDDDGTAETVHHHHIRPLASPSA